MGFWSELRLHPNQTEWILARVKRNECLEYEQDLRSNQWCAHDLFVSQVRARSARRAPAQHACAAPLPSQLSATEVEVQLALGGQRGPARPAACCRAGLWHVLEEPDGAEQGGGGLVLGL